MENRAGGPAGCLDCLEEIGVLTTIRLTAPMNISKRLSNGSTPIHFCPEQKWLPFSIPRYFTQNRMRDSLLEKAKEAFDAENIKTAQNTF